MTTARRLAIVSLAAAACSSPARPAEDQARPPDPTGPVPAAAAAAADAAPVPRPAPAQPLVSYGGASVFGGDSFVIQPDGSARFSFAAPGKPEIVKTGAIAPAELAALERSLTSAGCCALTSQRTMGVPDEGHTQLLVGFPGLACAVSLWDNEWHDLPGAAACAKIIDRVRRRLR